MSLSFFFPYIFFFFNDPATTEIYTLSLHDALPISHPRRGFRFRRQAGTDSDSGRRSCGTAQRQEGHQQAIAVSRLRRDRKSTRLNSSHQIISYAVFCLKKKKQKQTTKQRNNLITFK